MNFVNTIEVDAVIVGGGLAGLTAARHLAPHARVALLAKCPLSLSNSTWAQGGIAAAMGPDDAPALHASDTLRAGRSLCNAAAVDVLVHEGPERVRDLVALGVPFDRVGEALALGLEGGHGRRRIVHAHGAATGAAVTHAMAEAVRREPTVALHEGWTAHDLILYQDRCCGVLARDASGRWTRFLAPATILATGGAAGLYARTTNPAATRGEGVALAFRAGAAVADLEFIQFHPTALVHPDGGFLLSEAIRGEGAHLRNVHGARFMSRVHPRAELAPRDVVARAILREMETTGAPHVWLDLSPLSEEAIEEHFATLHARCLALGLDMRREPLPVAPAAHYAMGGVCTDLDGATTVPGLFACGEVACTGVQGANRLASNSLLECLVFGRRSAQAVLPLVRGGEQATPPPMTAPPTLPPRNAGADARLGALLWQHAGLVRDASGLRALLAELDAMRRVDPSARLVARLLATGALLRTESRGGHFRRDFPQEEPAWRWRIVFQQGHAPRLLGVEAEGARQMDAGFDAASLPRTA